MNLDRAILRRGDAYLVDLETLEMSAAADARMRAVVMTIEQLKETFSRLVETSLTSDEYCAEDPPDRDHVRGILRCGESYVSNPETLEMVSGPWASERAAVVNVAQMRLIQYRLNASGIEAEFEEIDSPGAMPSDFAHQSFSPADIYAAAQMCERWRRAIEAEVALRPELAKPLNNVFIDLCVARDVLADCAQEVEKYFQSTHPDKQPRPEELAN
jgi:hypothetical protein